MKKFLLTSCAICLGMLCFAQVTKGKVTYERVSQIQVQFAGMPDGLAQQMPKSRTDKFELSFANNQTLWKQAESENTEDPSVVSDGGGMQMHIMVAGSDDVLFSDLNNKTRVEKRELMDRQFIIDDSLRTFKWKMGEETKTILGHLCRAATATNISSRMMMNINNGNMERKEVQDTSNITAWFTTDIPVSAGPAEYQGQLPGLILAMDVNNGRQTFLATSIEEKVDIAEIKQPSGKKHYTPEEFRKERDKMMADMQRNNGGGRQVIRMN